MDLQKNLIVIFSIFFASIPQSWGAKPPSCTSYWLHNFSVPQEQLEQLEKDAEAGDINAQYKMGVIYGSGFCDGDTASTYRQRHNNSKSRELLEAASEKGLAAAQYALGKSYSVGSDNSEAIALFEESANQGYAEAQDALGFFYLSNFFGVKQDYDKAFELFQKAANQGLAEAQDHLGNMYKEGLGMPKDYAKAFEWTKKAADQKLTWGVYHLGFFYRDGLVVPKDEAIAFGLFEKSLNSMHGGEFCQSFQEIGKPRYHHKAFEAYNRLGGRFIMESVN